jgi:hypothetical protein
LRLVNYKGLTPSLVYRPPGPNPLNHLTRILVYGPVPYILRSLYSILTVFIALYYLRIPYEKVYMVLVKWGVSLNMEILFGTLG